MMSSEPDQLISTISILARQIQTDLDAALASTPLNASNYYFVLKLGRVTEIPQDALFKTIHLDASNVTRRLAQLITLGLVAKHHPAGDRRAWVLSLTPQGRQLVPVVTQLVADYEARFTARLTTDEKATAERMLNLLADPTTEVTR